MDISSSVLLAVNMSIHFVPYGAWYIELSTVTSWISLSPNFFFLRQPKFLVALKKKHIMDVCPKFQLIYDMSVITLLNRLL